MCNLYSHTRNVEAMRKLFAPFNDGGANFANLPPQPNINPDRPAPIIRNAEAGPELAMVRWGMPSSRKALYDAASERAEQLRAKGKPVDFEELVRLEPDRGTTNIRRTDSKHWQRWLGARSGRWYAAPGVDILQRKVESACERYRGAENSTADRQAERELESR
ncbi:MULTISPECIES: hypothetical protein [unclassified Bosea (in: a-proteobacteria)]|uniref:hypothetical protein n=1 Tax=unclassified Bosea (in: a-proteobacteria) TaxID=2653178 RepID=UPI000F7615E9|nr:hypothetical protein BLM15_29490 [Bosea sp. Tri-49]RXT16865.1 hypothetical protein B5U98_27295 [Bosea sp. Tri-39]RXT37769.1 hypothetical protein B5U99_12570 [Bosea sp. Tri-54]